VPESVNLVFSHVNFNKPKNDNQWNSKNGFRVEIPVFGLQIPRLLYKILQVQSVQDVWNCYGLKCNLEVDTNIAQFAVKLLPLEKILREEGEIDAANRLQNFMIWFGSLNRKSVTTFDKWVEQVSQFLLPGWELPEGLEINRLIPLLGVEEGKAKRIMENILKEEQVKDPKKKVGDTYVRWLSKFASGFRIAGCVTDLVNLLFAMYHGYTEVHVTEATEISLVIMLQDILDHLEKNDWSVFKIFMKFIFMDAEDDDVWAYMFSLAAACQTNLSEPVCLMQLPSVDFSFVASRFSIDSNNILYDDMSKNQKKLEIIHVR
jgi:hypothetical protein